MITTYKLGSREYKRLEAAAALLTANSPHGTTYIVEDVYFDLGQDWMWTTVVAYRKNGSSWQALCPREQEMITDGNPLAEILEAVELVISSEFNPDR